MRTSHTPLFTPADNYPVHQPSELNQLLEHAAEALAQKYKREGTFTSPKKRDGILKAQTRRVRS